MSFQRSVKIRRNSWQMNSVETFSSTTCSEQGQLWNHQFTQIQSVLGKSPRMEAAQRDVHWLPLLWRGFFNIQAKEAQVCLSSQSRYPSPQSCWLSAKLAAVYQYIYCIWRPKSGCCVLCGLTSVESSDCILAIRVAFSSTVLLDWIGGSLAFLVGLFVF